MNMAYTMIIRHKILEDHESDTFKKFSILNDKEKYLQDR